MKERFLKKVKKTNYCWIWTSAEATNGYGIFGIERKTCLAHRVAWELFRGPIPKDMCVCHTCDNRKCVNPDHLFLGTYQDNAHDMIRKGRHSKCGSPPGEKNHRHKLKESDVLNVRYLYKTGRFKYKKLAELYGVKPSAIAKIVTRKTWKHI